MPLMLADFLFYVASVVDEGIDRHHLGGKFTPLYVPITGMDF